MAIPISWPSSDEVEDSYRSLDLLLEQLLVTVRQVLVQRRQRRLSSLSNSRRRSPVTSDRPLTSPDTPTAADSPSHPRLPLPDVVPESDCEDPRRKMPSSSSPERTNSDVSSWIQVGAELRRIADAFRSDRAPAQNSAEGKSTRLKEVSLLSVLCPALGSSIWTTVALLIGWGIFNKKR